MKQAELFSNLEFPEDVRNKALELYNQLRISNPRKNNKMKAICFCIHQVYLDIGKPKDTIMVGRRLGLSDRDSDSSITEYSKKLPQDRDNIHHFGYVSVEDLIRAYSEPDYFNFTTDAISDIISLWNSLKEKDSRLEQRQARTLVAGIIYMYLIANNISITDDYYTTFGITKATVLLIYRVLYDVNNITLTTTQ